MRRTRYVAGLLLAGCGAFEAESTPRGAKNGGPPDGGADTHGMPASDASADGEAGSPPATCTSSFCADFEDGIGTGWQAVTLGYPATNGWGPGHQSTHSFRSDVGGAEEGTERRAQLKTIFSSVAKLTCTFWVNVIQSNDDSDFLAVVYDRKSPEEYSYVWVDTTSSGISLLPDGTPGPALSGWHEVTFTLGNSQLLLQIDGGAAISQSVGVPGPWSSIEVVLGAYTTKAEGARIDYDDVSCIQE